jgi:hypothetical protein
MRPVVWSALTITTRRWLVEGQQEEIEPGISRNTSSLKRRPDCPTYPLDSVLDGEWGQLPSKADSIARADEKLVNSMLCSQGSSLAAIRANKGQMAHEMTTIRVNSTLLSAFSQRDLARSNPPFAPKRA